MPRSQTRATPPRGARSGRARTGISGCPIGLCDVGGLIACRLLESSADLHDVRDCLGHANIATTSRPEYAGASGTGAGADGSVSRDRGRRGEPAAPCGALTGAPTTTLARIRNERIEKVRSHIHLARKNGLLTETKPGKAGGALTSLALAVLEEAKL